MKVIKRKKKEGKKLTKKPRKIIKHKASEFYKSFEISFMLKLNSMNHS